MKFVNDMWPVTWFTPLCSTNRTFDYDVAEIFLKVYDKSVFHQE
jgi:hypothetical protein